MIKHVNIKHTVGINDMLSFVNLIVFSLIIYVLFFNQSVEDNPYVNWITLVMGLTLCIQTHILLRLEKRNSNPFALILAYVTTIYYSLRIFTITLYPFSAVFDRGLYGPADSNFSMLIILISNTFLAAGLFSLKKTFEPEINTSGYKPKQPKVAFILLCALLILSILYASFQSDIPKFISLLLIFFDPINFFLITAIFVMTFHLQINIFYKYTLIVVALTLCALQTLSGSRSGILTYLNFLFFLLVVLVPFFRVKIKSFAILCMLSPLLFFLLYSIFTYTTLSRGMLQGSGVNLTVAEKYLIVKNTREMNDNSLIYEEMISLNLARAGFFDFTSEIIAHRKMYDEIFTPLSYIKSFVDNVFTPGFDVFDYPKIGNAVSFAYRGDRDIKKSAILFEGYQSDQITIIAELFSLFWYGSFIILFLIGRLFVYFYKKSGNESPFNLALKRFFMCLIFYKLLLSFGLDWLTLDVIVILITVKLIKRLFQVDRIPLSKLTNP